MSELELIAKVGADYLEKKLGTLVDEESTARFLLDSLTGQQVAALCREILSRPRLSKICQIRVPRKLIENQELPENILTDEKTTYWRHAPCEKPVLILANTDDEQGQSLRDILPIGSTELISETELWVERAAEDASLTADQKKWWSKALRGLLQVKPQTLPIFSEYILKTREGLTAESLPIVLGLGWALPALRVPRDSACFNSIPEKMLGRTDRWRRVYNFIFSKRAPYLYKLYPTSGQPIEKEQLEQQWETLRASNLIGTEHIEIFESFLKIPPHKWTQEVAALAELEWNGDRVSQLFEGLRKTGTKKLGEQTIEFYEELAEEFKTLISDDELDLLRRLDKRNAKEANDEEREFYESHSKELSRNRRLKARWDRYVFGSPIECTDFSVGLLKAVGKLFEQAGAAHGKKELRIEAGKRGKRDWVRDHSEDSVRYFVSRYRGLPEVISKGVQWNLMRLFQYDEIYEDEKKRLGKKFRPNRSSSMAANQIKFNVDLNVEEDGEREEYAVQVIWSFNPDSVCSELAGDLMRLSKHPFLRSEVTCESVSVKGRMQNIDLSNVQTFMPVHGQDRGYLIPAYTSEKNIEKKWLRNLEQSLETGLITKAGYEALKKAWEGFSDSYGSAINEFLGAGLASQAVLNLESAYLELLQCLHQDAPGDKNRISLWFPILEIGVTKVQGTDAAVIIPPWHPLRLISIVAKGRQLAGLLNHLLRPGIVNFGDARLFFDDITHEIAQPYYPEIALTTHGTEPITLAVSDFYADYTLMEPLGGQVNRTNENPTEAAKTIRNLVKRYLDLQPHEKANLSIVLYNCDSVRLPEATVNSLSGMHENEEEVRCQIILRHRSSRKLASLYQTLLENAGDDQDSYVTSEAYRDFMSRLRIGILADEEQIPESDSPFTDLVFLQDVIARNARPMWQHEDSTGSVSNIIDYYPPRWSRRRASTRDDMRSVVYLACPIQPEVGWAYLRTIRSIESGNEPESDRNYIPALEISFQNNETRTIFEEVHRLGQWVINYDSLLERRQLRNQNVQVIKYQQARHGGRNMIVSSKAPLTLLDVMIKRRLRELMAGTTLSDQELSDITVRMRDEANDISGDIVLRAAKRGRFVNELIGLVLSRAIVENEMGGSKPIGWYFLDDYSKWLGQKEQHLADIMALSPGLDSERNRILKITVTEAKYIDSGSLAQESRKSARQLHETVERIQDAIFGAPGRLDRDFWLSRIADMLLDGIELAPTGEIKINEFREEIRKGNVKILLRGYSHVFVHTQQLGEGDPSSSTPLKVTENCWQEIYGKEKVQQLVMAYQNKEPVFEIRKKIGEAEPWREGKPQPPSPRVKWADISDSAEERKPVEETETEKAAEISQERPSKITAEERVELTIDEASPFAWASPPLQGVLYDLAEQISPPEVDEAWLKEAVARLRNALIKYGMQAKLLDQRLTPNAALAIFQGTDLLTETQIAAKRSQLLTVHSLDVRNVVPEPGRIVVSVARPKRQTISLVQQWKNRLLSGQPKEPNLKLIIGARESSGETLYLEPAIKDAPHTLIAGTTGSGKSILLQNLILDIACTNTPNQAKIYLIDPKQGLDYSLLQSLSHISNGIVTEQEKAAELLKTVVQEMHKRMEEMSGKASNVLQHNSLVAESERFPIIWLFHDEFAAWMIDEDYKKLVSNTVQQLGMMARAAGIFLIFAAQRPEAKVMTAQLRSNLDNRLILRVASEADSEMSLGEKGAEQLLGKGHIAVRLPEEQGIILAQVPYLTPNDVAKIVGEIKNRHYNII